MFDVGFSEITLIMVIALIVVGPERLPKLARTLGRWVSKARTIVSSVKTEVEREIRVEELKKSIQQQTPIEEFKKLADDVKGDLKAVGSGVESVGSDIKAGIQQSARSTGNANRQPRVEDGTTDASPAAANAPNAATDAKSNTSAE